MGRLYPARIRKFQKMRRNADVRTVLLRGTLLCWLFAACIAAPANDGTYYTSGNQLLPLVETDIHVWREVLTLSWGEDRTEDVDVYYAFYNPGEEKTDLMWTGKYPEASDKRAYGLIGISRLISKISEKRSIIRLIEIPAKMIRPKHIHKSTITINSDGKKLDVLCLEHFSIGPKLICK